MIDQGKGCKWRGKSSQYRAGKASLRGASRRAPAAGQIHEEIINPSSRLTLFCDGLPAGPPGGLPAGACSGLATNKKD